MKGEDPMALMTAMLKAHRSIPECVSIGLVEVPTGRVLASTPLDASGLDPADAAELRGETFFTGGAEALEHLIGGAGDATPDGPRFREVLAFGESVVHVVLRGRERRDLAAVVVCRANVNLDDMLARIRTQLPELERALVAQAA